MSEDRTSKISAVKLRVLVAHGVDLDLLGTREPQHYGYLTLSQLNQYIQDKLPTLRELAGEQRDVELTFLQTNSEPELLMRLDGGWDGCVINAGAWTHTSQMLGDQLRTLRLPYAEVHLSNLAARESFRHHSYLSAGAVGVAYGMRADSYICGLYALLRHLAGLRDAG